MSFDRNYSVAKSFRLDGKHALITGGGGGIGAGIALALCQAGASVTLVGRTESALRDVASELQSEGHEASIIVCDITDSAAIRSVIDGLPQLDILVNNAGTNFPQPVQDVTDENLDLMLNLNVRALFVTSQAAIKRMLESGDAAESCVINVTSQMGHVGSPNRSVYCMTKHAIEGLTKALAIELASSGIRVNSIAPTFVDTPLIRKIVDTPEKYDFLVSKIPLGHMADISDIVGAAVYLASPAARMVTGTCIRVDGGWTAQ
ncbi:SDR family NAD(P)-dependent oxidoreductase [Pseudomonas sp. IT-P218]|uniref:SDR family NAD(P)-dependent oxidoreductase n=1 Tax=Pseudomonas sp. IT-P218 TaxID=3026449 RepID=UPI0039E192CC